MSAKSSTTVVRLPLTAEEDRQLTMLARLNGVSKGEMIVRAWEQWKVRNG